jgi:hypothetical protein
MRMTRGWTGLRTAVIALGLLAWNAPHADAAATTTSTATVTTPDLLEYSVAGIVGNTGITGSNVISYVPVQSAVIDPTSNIPLGSFQVAPLPVGQTTTYDNTPFTLTFVPTGFNGSTLSDTPITVTGTLSGTVTGPYQSSVQVSFNSLTDNGFALATGSSSTLDLLPGDQKLLVPSSAGGVTTMEAQISTTGLQVPAPEPSTIALFLSTVCGLGLRRYVQVRRQKVHA